jgi:hypothetical protein
MKVTYHDSGAGIAEPHLIKGLYNHLSNSGLPRFTELVGDKGKLKNLAVRIGRYTQAYQEFLKSIINGVERPVKN